MVGILPPYNQPSPLVATKQTNHSRCLSLRFKTVKYYYYTISRTLHLLFSRVILSIFKQLSAIFIERYQEFP